MLYVTTTLLSDKTADATFLVQGYDFPGTYLVFSEFLALYSYTSNLGMTYNPYVVLNFCHTHFMSGNGVIFVYLAFKDQ